MTIVTDSIMNRKVSIHAMVAILFKLMFSPRNIHEDREIGSRGRTIIELNYNFLIEMFS